MVAILFPGQGAQFVGMGQSVFDKFPEYINRANAILGYDLKELCLSSSLYRLSLTQYTQPALFVVSALHYLDYMKNNKRPNYVMGHSVGEYAALFAAGSFDFETGVELVRKRGELMASSPQGAMLVVFDLTISELRDILKENNFDDDIDIANHNTKKQIVVSGSNDKIESAAELIENSFYVTKKIKVSGPFHSRYMKQVAISFADYLEQFDIGAPEIPAIANVTAKPYEDNESLKHMLVEQIYSTVQWHESIRFLLNAGEVDFRDLGPGEVVGKMVDKVKKEG